MRPLVLVALGLGFAVSASGCSSKHSGSAKLEGHWRGQSATGVPPDTQINANVYALGTELVARGNQISISTPAAKNVTATYTVDKEDAATVIIHTDRDATTETFTFQDARTMTWRVDERRSIVFKKID